MLLIIHGNKKAIGTFGAKIIDGSRELLTLPRANSIECVKANCTQEVLYYTTSVSQLFIQFRRVVSP